MNANAIWAGEEIMVNARRRSEFYGSFAGTSIALLAGLLILLGIVLQLGELGYGHINASNLWLVSMITQGVWNLISTHVAGFWGDVLRFWPLALVGIGAGILLLCLERA